MSTRAAIDMINSAFVVNKIALPKPFAAVMAERSKIEAVATALRPPSHADVGEAMLTAVIDGRDPLDDPEVARLGALFALAGDTGNGIEHLIGQALDRRTLTAITGCADDIVAAVKVCADEHGERLTEAHRILGDIDMSDSASVLQLGVDAAAAWIAAKNSIKAIDTLDSAWVTLGRITGRASDSAPPALRLADPPLEVYEKLQFRCKAWEIITAGGTIDVATFDDIAERVQRITTEREARDAAQPTFEDTYRQQRGHGGVLV